MLDAVEGLAALAVSVLAMALVPIGIRTRSFRRAPGGASLRGRGRVGGCGDRSLRRH